MPPVQHFLYSLVSESEETPNGELITTDLYAHFDAEDSSSIALDGSSNITTWSSKVNSGNVFATQSNASKRPSVSSVGAVNVINCESTKGLSIVDTIAQAQSAFTLMIAVKPKDNNLFFMMGENDNTAFKYAGFEHNDSNSGNSPNVLDFIAGWGRDARINYTGVSTLNEWHLWSITCPGLQSNLKFRDEGTQVTNITQTGADGTYNFKLGASTEQNIDTAWASGIRNSAEFAEILFYDRVLTNQEIQSNELYLASKWSDLGIAVPFEYVSVDWQNIFYNIEYDDSDGWQYTDSVIDLTANGATSFTLEVEPTGFSAGNGVDFGFGKIGNTTHIRYTTYQGTIYKNGSIHSTDAGDTPTLPALMKAVLYSDRVEFYVKDSDQYATETLVYTENDSAYADGTYRGLVVAGPGGSYKVKQAYYS